MIARIPHVGAGWQGVRRVGSHLREKADESVEQMMMGFGMFVKEYSTFGECFAISGKDGVEKAL